MHEHRQRHYAEQHQAGADRHREIGNAAVGAAVNRPKHEKQIDDRGDEQSDRSLRAPIRHETVDQARA